MRHRPRPHADRPPSLSFRPCRKPRHAIADFTGQNGKNADQSPLIANDCGGKGKAKKGQRHSGR